MDSLEIDIDSYDCELMETMLSLSSPKVVAVEFNPIFPPKVVYMQKYKEGIYIWFFLKQLGSSYAGDTFHGCSLSAVTVIASKYNYKLLYTRLFEAFFIKQVLESLDNRNQEYAVMFRGMPFGEREVFSSGQYQRNFLEYLYNRGIYIKHYDSWVPVINDWHDVNQLAQYESGSKEVTFCMIKI